MQECPQFETLQALLERSLDAALLLEVESHINSCENCQQVLQQLSAANEETQTQPAGDQETSEANPRLTIADRIAQYEANHVRSGPFAQANLPEVDGYEIESLIARGGMGVVYRALQKEANRTVALKMMLQGAYASAEEVTRFQIEARAAARLTHQYIVPIHDVGTCRGQHYFSMGYIAGSSCKDLIQEGPLPNRECAELLLQWKILAEEDDFSKTEAAKEAQDAKDLDAFRQRMIELNEERNQTLARIEEVEREQLSAIHVQNEIQRERNVIEREQTQEMRKENELSRKRDRRDADHQRWIRGKMASW